MLAVLLIALVVVISTISLNYEALRFVAYVLFGWPRSPHLRILLGVLATFITHMISVALYAAAYAGMETLLHIGHLVGPRATLTLEDYFYFSAITYTTLGYGDLVPQDHFRLLAGIESLNGLMLISWSATYTYLTLERHWLSKFTRVTHKIEIREDQA